jgi:hypothetical protein
MFLPEFCLTRKTFPKRPLDGRFLSLAAWTRSCEEVKTKNVRMGKSFIPQRCVNALRAAGPIPGLGVHNE